MSLEKLTAEDFGEELRVSVKRIREALRATPLTQRALILLISDLSNVTKTDVKYVLNSIDALESEYFKKPKGK